MHSTKKHHSRKPRSSKKKHEAPAPPKKTAPYFKSTSSTGDASSSVTLRIDSQLQNDMQTEQALIIGQNQLTVLFDNDSSDSQIYYTNSNGINNAYQTEDGWKVENTSFPTGSTPAMLTSCGFTNKSGFVFALDTTNVLWMIDESVKWLKWASMGPLPVAGNILDIRSTYIEANNNNFIQYVSLVILLCYL
jgi:hypothetical protein